MVTLNSIILKPVLPMFLFFFFLFYLFFRDSSYEIVYNLLSCIYSRIYSVVSNFVSGGCRSFSPWLSWRWTGRTQTVPPSSWGTHRRGAASGHTPGTGSTLQTSFLRSVHFKNNMSLLILTAWGPITFSLGVQYNMCKWWVDNVQVYCDMWI